MIDGISSGIAGAYNAAGRVSQPAATSGVGFGDMVADAIGNVRDTVNRTEQASLASLNDEISLEELATAVADAEVTLKAVVAIRDRIISAYQDIMKMPI